MQTIHDSLSIETIVNIIKSEFDDIEAHDTWGELSFFYNPNQLRKRGAYFSTLKQKDGENDIASNLNRPGAFRLNFGLPTPLFIDMFGPKPKRPAKGQSIEGPWDFTIFNTIMPHARCALMTSDHLSSSQKVFDQVKEIQAHEVDILIGTQIMAKGHHFPLLTLVGIVDGDSALSGSDLRASEKAFQLLHQVSGRSGREHRRGQVLLQTHIPEHPVMQALLHQDRGEFFALESDQRLIHGFPPYGRLAALILSGKKPEDVEKTARQFARIFPLTEKAELLGPTPAPIPFLRGNYRWRLLLKTAKDTPPHPLLKSWLSQARLPSSVKLQIDIDPYSFF